MKNIIVISFFLLFSFSMSEGNYEDDPNSFHLEIFIRTRNMSDETVTFVATTQSNPRWTGLGYLTSGMTTASISIDGNYSGVIKGFDSNGEEVQEGVGSLGRATYLLTVNDEFNTKTASILLVCNGWNFTLDKWLLYDYQADSFYITATHDMTPIENVTGGSIVTYDTQNPTYCALQPTVPQTLQISNYNGHPKLIWTASAPSGGTKYQIYRNNDLVYTTNIGETDWIDEYIVIGGGANAPFKYKVQGLSGYDSKTSNGYSNEVTVNGIRYDKQQQQTTTSGQTQWTSTISDIFPNPFNPETLIRFTVGDEQNVNITVFDEAGKEVKILLDAVKPKGEYEIRFNASHLSSGVYYCRMISGKHTDTKKTVLQK